MQQAPTMDMFFVRCVASGDTQRGTNSGTQLESGLVGQAIQSAGGLQEGKMTDTQQGLVSPQGPEHVAFKDTGPHTVFHNPPVNADPIQGGADVPSAGRQATTEKST
jgi:hypothetical protein